MSQPARQDSEFSEDDLAILAHSAIEAALAGKWEEALTVNKKILSQNPLDVDALNRLARAQLETGKLKEAQITLKKVLKIDKFNSIAERSLEKLKKTRPKKVQGNDSNNNHLPADFFLEEPGKTKTVTLLHLGDPKVVSLLDNADTVKIITHKHRVSITNEEGQYIGRLPDDIAIRLIRLIKAGNSYLARVKLADPDNLKIFIREERRSENLKDTPSFTFSEKVNYVAYTAPESVHPDKPEVENEEEQAF